MQAELYQIIPQESPINLRLIGNRGDKAPNFGTLKIPSFLANPKELILIDKY